MKLCAICHNTNETVAICRKCQKENPEWTSAAWIGIPNGFETDEIVKPTGTRDKSTTLLQQRILQLALFGRELSFDEFRRGLFNRAKRIPAIPHSQIANVLKCHVNYVQRTLALYLKR